MAPMDDPAAVVVRVRPLRRAAVLVRDLAALHLRVTALGLTVICPPVSFAPPGGQTALEMTFRDFDGALVNLIESS